MKARIVFVVVALTSLFAAASASAHVQVNPSEVATDDSVKFSVLVPGETSARTVKVELAVPKDVIPFSFAETTGWKRKLTENPDGSTKSIVWTGTAEPDGFVEFSFLASTPANPTTLEWKSIQTYSDGQVVRWIGSPESEYPASTTSVSADLPKQGAGGKHSGSDGGHESHSATNAQSPSWLQPVAISALILALIAAIVAFAAYRRNGP